MRTVRGIYSLLYLLLFASLFVNLGLGYSLGFDAVTKLLVDNITVLLDNTSTILLKRLIDTNISRCKSSITLIENIVRSQDATNRCDSENNCGSIQLSDLHTSLRICNSKILLAVLLAILTLKSFILNSSMDNINVTLGLLKNALELSSSPASKNRTCDSSNNTNTNENCRCVLL